MSAITKPLAHGIVLSIDDDEGSIDSECEGFDENYDENIVPVDFSENG